MIRVRHLAVLMSKWFERNWRKVVLVMVVLVAPLAARAVGPEVVTAPGFVPGAVGGLVGGLVGSWRVNGRTLTRAARRAARAVLSQHLTQYHRR